MVHRAIVIIIDFVIILLLLLLILLITNLWYDARCKALWHWAAPLPVRQAGCLEIFFIFVFYQFLIVSILTFLFFRQAGCLDILIFTSFFSSSINYYFSFQIFYFSAKQVTQIFYLLFLFLIFRVYYISYYFNFQITLFLPSRLP